MRNVYPQLSKPTTTQLKGKNSQTLVKTSTRTGVIKFRAWKILVFYHKKSKGDLSHQNKGSYILIIDIN